MYPLKFIKMHGLGNDFILINQDDLLACNAKYSEMNNKQQMVKRLAARHTGLGCDQLIIYKILDHSKWQMLIFNSDGTPAKACGNATRCLAYLAARDHGVSTLKIEVAGRYLTCKVNDDNTITVNMGSISFDEKWMPESSKLWQLASIYKLELKEILCADAGNPHLVIFNNNLSQEDMLLLGSKIEHGDLFPEGVNVNFAKVQGNDILLKVWERGTGFTLACGSGACASFAAAHKLGFVGENSSVLFELGNLKLSQQGTNILMTGPATFVAEGNIYV